MICKSCEGDSPAGARFCMHCGEALARACPGCGGALPAEATFCAHCGRRVNDPEPAAVSTLPAADAADGLQGERRNVTVVFSDLVGYTALNERMDPEEVAAVMDRIKTEAVAVIERHGGIVNQFVGDEVLALFGIPVAHEDDPRRAVRAALELHAFVDGVGEEVRARTGQQLRMHTGINTGLVVLRLRDPRSGNYTITGDAVNTAARLVSLAQGGEVLVSPETQQLIAPFYESEALPAAALKGKAHRVTPYRILGASDVRSRFEAAARQGLTPYTPDDGVLEPLQSALTAVESGAGRVVSIGGDAGLGKSRLVWEFRHAFGARRLTVVEGACDAFSGEIPYRPFIEALRQHWALSPSDSPDALRAKVLAQVEARGTLTPHLPFYLNLLSLPARDYPLPPHLAGQELAAAFAEALLAWLLDAGDHPRVLLLEDWHWADVPSQALLKSLAGRLGTAPLLVVVTWRPEVEVTWPANAPVTTVVMAPLNATRCGALVRGVLGVAALPAGLVERIQERTGGNPLFVEELVGTLLHEGLLEVQDGEAVLVRDLEAAELPGTVQALIRSRLDRLERAERETLGLASVVGPQFTRALLARLAVKVSQVTARLDSHLDEALEGLQRLDLIRPARVAAEPVFRFVQMLTRQVAYETLLRERRRELHGQVASALVALYPERLDEYAELLQHHYAAAEEWERAAQYAGRAGAKAHAMSQFQQAARAYEQGAEYLGRLTGNRQTRLKQADLRLEACFCLINLGRFDEAIAAGERMESHVLALDAPDRWVRLMVMLGTCWMYRGDRKRCEHYLLPALEMPELEGDALTLANCKHVLAGCYVGQGLWKLAAPYLEEAVALYEREGVQEAYLYGYFALPYVVGCAQLGMTWAFQGRAAEATDLFRRTLPHALGPVSNFSTKGVYFSWLSVFSALVGEDRLAVQPMVEAMVRKAEASDSPFLLLAGRVVQTNFLLAQGRFEDTRNLATQAVAALQDSAIKTGHMANLYYNLIVAELSEDALESAREHLAAARPLQPLSPHWFGPRFDMLEAVLTHRAGEHAAAHALFERSIAGDEEAGAVLLAEQTRYHLAQAWLREGREPEGRGLLGELAERYAQRGLPTWERLCRRALAASDAVE